MANVKAVIDVDINTSPAAAGLRSLQSQFNAFSQTLNTANASHKRFAKENAQQLSSLVNATQFFTAETVKMRTAASQLDLTLAKGSTTMGQFFSARFRKDGLAAAQVMSLANARASAMQTQFIATGAAANGMREALAIRPLQAFNSAAVVSAQKLAIQRAMLNQATTSMINFGKNTQWAGRQLMVGFTVPLTIFAGVAGKAFRDLEKEAINFRKVYGDIFTTDIETEDALQSVRQLSTEFTKYGVEAKKTMQLAAIAAQAGQQGAQLMAATTQATRLAVLGDMENQDAMRTTIALQSAFKMSNEELAESINFLNMVENSSVLALQDVAEAIPRVAPVIQGLGGDVKDLSVMLVAMREGGVSAAEAANGLKSSLGRLITPSRQAKDMATSFGINLDRIVRKNAGDVLGTVMELANAMKSLGQIEQQQLLSTIFGKFQYARIGALFENITRDGSQAQRVLEMMAMSTEDMAATAEKELSAIEESVSTKFTAAIERMKVAIAPIGELFVKMALPIVNFLAKIAESFNNLPDFAKNFIAFGAALVGLVIPAGTMFAGLLMNLIGTLIKVGHLIGLAFKGFMSGGLAGAINNVSQALNYMSLEEIDATNSATQMAGATGAANEAFRAQVGAAAGAKAAIDQLGITYDIVYQKIMKIASANTMAFGPGAAAMRGAAGPATARAAARGVTLTRLNKGGTAPGVGNKDTVPAMLTPGEFVVNKQATEQNLPLLRAINDGEKLPGFNKGGQIPGVQYAMSGMLIKTRQDLLNRVAALQGFRPEVPATRQSVRIGGMSRSESIYQQFMAKNADTSTKNARVVRFAVEKLGISPGELGLTSRGNYGFVLSPESNIRMAKGTLTKQDLLNDLMNPSALNPLSDQLGRYFRMGIDKDRFSSLLTTNINNLPVDLITNKRFEQAARKTLYEYLRSERIPRRQAGQFMKDLLQRTEVSSGLKVERLEEALALKGIAARRGGRKDYYVNYQGEELNLGRLLGQEIESLPKPSDIIRFTRQRDAKSVVPRGMVFAHANKGGMIPGLQHLVRGGGVLSRAAQVAQIQKASPFGNIEDRSLRSMFGLRFNDIQADGPADFVKGMFGRWERVPTRISPKEDARMLLRGKKPRYPAVAQEDYLADMIISANKFSDVPDVFKPITIGKMRGRDETRIFDGHTRIHSQVVKGLIERKLGKSTLGMTKDELVDSIRTIKAMSDSGQITNTDVLRATAGQRVLVKSATTREVDQLFDHPLRRKRMASMYNMQGRTLIPGIHDREITTIVDAAKKANFYGVKKDPESLMKSMGFVSIGGQYRYDPSVDFRNRSSYVNNMGRRIIDKLVDEKSILPLRRNKGGMIPGMQYLAGGGIAMLLQNISRQRSMLSGARSFKMLPSGRAARSDRQLFEQEGINFARWSRVSGSGARGAGYREAVAAGYITDEERSNISGRVIAHAIGGRFKRRMAQLGGQEGGYPAGTFQSILGIARSPQGSFLPGGSRSASFARQQADIAQALPSSLVSVPLKFNNEIARGTGTISSLGRIGPEHMASLMENLMQRNVPPAIARAVLTRAAVGLKRNLRRFDGRINESVFYRELAKAENQALIRYEDDFIRLGITANEGGMIPGGQVDPSRSFYGIAPRALQALRTYMAGGTYAMEDAKSRRLIMGLARPMSGTFYRGTQLGAGTLPKNIEGAIRQAEKTGDFSKLVGQRFRMRASDWSTDKTTAQRFTQMNQIKDKQDFLINQKKIAEKNILSDTLLLSDFEAGRTPWMQPKRVEDARRGLDFWQKDLARINKELEQIGELSPLILKTQGKIKGVPASQLIPDATYLGKPINENNIISSSGMYEIRKASRGNLEIVPVQSRNMGGPIFESARKTIVPGVGNTDTVPAALTPGEFVINKQATKQNLGLLHAINSGKALGMNMGGRVPGVQYLEDGGGVRGFREKLKEVVLLSKKNREMAKEAKILEKTVAARMKNLKAEEKTQKMGGMKAMGASMGMAMGGMGVMMLGQQMQASAAEKGESSAMGSALSTGGMGLSMASVLPFLPFAKILAPIVVAIGAAAGGLYLLRKTSDDIARRGQELGSNMGGAANALNEIAKITGTATPLQRAAKLQLGVTEKEEQLLQESEAVQRFAFSESGQKFLQDLSKLTSAERFEKLFSYLQYGVAGEIFDLDTAKAFGKTIAAEIGDPAIGAAIAQRLQTQRTGSAGIIGLAEERVQKVSPLIETATQQTTLTSIDANKIIGGSLQIVQDFANAEALARKEFAEGKITYEELRKVVEKSTEIQNQYTDAVQSALEKTDALGSTLLGLKESLISLNLTPEQAAAIEQAGQDVVFQIDQKDLDLREILSSPAKGFLRGGPIGALVEQQKAFSVPGRLQAGFQQLFSKDRTPGAVLGAITSGEVREVNEQRSAQLSTLAGSMALTPEDIAAFGQLLSENQELSDRFDKLIEEGVSPEKAAQGIVLAQKVTQGQFLGGVGRKIDEGERQQLERQAAALGPGLEKSRAEAQKILQDFDELEKKKIDIIAEISTKNIDPVAFETYINSIPAFRQLEISANISEMTPESAERFLADAQVLGGAVGNEIGLAIQTSAAYEKAFDKGQTEPLVKAFQEASKAGVAETVIKYAIRTEGANSPEDLQKKIKELTTSTKAINELPDEIVKGLKIDLQKPADIEKFGPIARELAANWDIIQNLNPNLNLVAAMEFLTMENGKPKTPLQAAAAVQKLNKAYRNLGNKNESVRKQAIFDIATAYAGQEGGDFTPEDVEKSLTTLRENFAKLDKMDPQIVSQLIQIQIETDVQGAREAEELLTLTESLGKTTDPEERRFILRRMDQLSASQKARQEKALARQKALASTRPTGDGGGGGGGGQKSILQQLQDEFKNLQSFYNSLNKYINSKTGEFQGAIAGPFGPQFIEYLRGQGEEGLKVLKGSADKLKKAYQEFIKVQQQQTANFIQTLPANFLAQARATQGETILRNRLANQGVIGETAETIVGGVDRATLSAYSAAVGKRQRNQERKAGTRKGKREKLTAEEQRAFEDVQKLVTGPTGAAAQEAVFAVATEGVKAQNRELKQLSAFAAQGVPSEIAEQLLSMGISAKMAADKPKRFKEIVKGLEEIQKGQNIQNIRKAFEDMGKDIQGTMSVMSAIPGASQETIDKLKGLGDMSGFSAEQIRAFNRTLIQMEVAAHQARPELDKLTDVLDRATAAMQADIEKLNRLEIRPMELNISKLQKEMHPFQDEIKRLEKLIKPLNKEIEDFNDQIQTQERLIRPLNKDIEKLREEEDELNKHYDERSKVLDRVARANEKVIAQQRGQLDIASALSRGDIAGAARATRELQATMAQQRMDDAKAALEKEREDKRLAITTQIEAKEKEIKTINEEIERIQGEIEKRQDTINGYTKLIAAENDKIADKQEQIEGIQRRIEASKEKQLALEERIYKAQLLQSMIATKRQIQEDARRGDREAVQFGLYQLEAQMAVAGTTPEQQASFFEGIPNAAAILQPMLQYQALGMEQIIRQVQSVITPAQQLAEILQQLQVNPGLNEAFNMIINNMKNGVLPSLESVIAKAAELGIDEDVAEEAHRIALELTTTSGATDGLNQNMLAMISDSQQVNGVIGAINAVIGALNLQAEAAANANRVRRQELEAAARVALAPFWAGAAPAKTTASAQAPKPQPPKKKKTPKKKTFGGMISYKGSTERAPGMAMGGKMKKYASGAFVPGTGITDSVPALLTPGEFVVRKSVAEVYGPMLQNLNSQIYPEMQKFAMGGFAAKTGAMTRGASMSMFPSLQNVTKIRAFPTMRGTNQQISVSSPRGSSTMNNANIEYNYSVNVNAQTDASADDIANAVVYKFRRMEARQVKGNRVG